MACTSPCFDCPYLRDSEPLHVEYEEMFEWVWKHHTSEDQIEPYICEEQGDICFGQIQMIANGVKSGLDPFSEIGEAVEGLKVNYKDYFWGPWEFMPHHGTKW